MHAKRLVVVPAFSWLAVAALAVAAFGADAPVPSHVASVGTVRLNGAIVLEKEKGPYHASGLWSEVYDLPKGTKLKAVRLNDFKVPGPACDVITQIRCAGPDGKWSDWTPGNILANGDFGSGVPGGCVLGKPEKDGPGLPRWASATLPGASGMALFWRAVATPGADVTFATSAGIGEPGKRSGIAARFNDAADKLAVQVSLFAPTDAAAPEWQRMAVGTVVPAAASAFEGLIAAAGPAKGADDKTTVRAADGSLTFAGPGAAAVLIQDGFSDAKLWQVARDSHAEWLGGHQPALVLKVEPQSAASAAFRTDAVAFKHEGWIELSATVSIDLAQAAVNVLLYDADEHPVSDYLSLRCLGRTGTYRIWGRCPVPKAAARLRPVLQAALDPAGKAGTAAFHSLAVRACEPPAPFEKRQPPYAVAFAAAVPAERLEVRSFLLTADPKLTPSFSGYAIDTE